MSRGRKNPRERWYEEEEYDAELEDAYASPPPGYRSASRPRKRRGWPWLCGGCVLGVLAVVLVAAIVGYIAINNSLTGVVPRDSSLPIIGGASTFTSPAQQSIALAALAHMQVQNQIGNITVTVDSSATNVTVTTLKRVKAANQQSANSEFGNITVNIQPAGTSSDALVVTATVPQSNIVGSHNDAVDIMVTLPQSLAGSATAPTNGQPSFALATTIGTISATGLSGMLTIKDDVGNVTVQQAQLAGASQLEAGTGDVTFDGSLDTTVSAGTLQPHYKMLSETGNLDVTLPADTNVVLDANTNSGAITSDFSLNVSNTGRSASFYGPLNPSGQPQAILTLDTSIGSVTLHKA